LDFTLQRIHREIKIWMKLKHQNIVPFIGVTTGFGPPETISLVSPWVPNGTLTNFLETYGAKLTLMVKLWLVRPICYCTLHSFPLIHGDLTGSNVLINTEGMACLVDFGLSTVIGGLEGGSSIAPSSHRPGAIRWTAPELLKDPEMSYSPTPKSDIYSFGSVTLQESYILSLGRLSADHVPQVLSNRIPWYTVRGTTAEFRIIAKLMEGETPPRPDDPPISEKHWALISECWRPISSMERRPTAVQLVVTISQEIANCSGETNGAYRLFRSAPNVYKDSCLSSEPLPGPTKYRKPLKLPRPTEDDSVDSIFAFSPPDREDETAVPHAVGVLSQQKQSKFCHRYPPINTLFVGNLPRNTGDYDEYLEIRLRSLFSPRPGYRNLLFTRKSDGRMMCFVDVR
ncbi:kinase-like domain-containing protein, partial [Suillus occidentalis]